MGIPYPTGNALSVQQIRELDILAIEHVGIPGVVLMENAGRGCAQFIYATLIAPEASHVLILCGPGNNGGDGFVIARHLRNAGVSVDVALAAAPEKSAGDAGINLAILRRMGLPLLHAFEDDGLEAVRQAASRADVIVDALLGTGSSGAPRKAMAKMIEYANTAPRARRIAIDIPSGLDAETGAVHEPCFRAAATITMLAPKLGFSTPAGREVLGRVIAVDIGTPRNLIPGRRQAGKGVDS
jgi:NAD(P)H-hydrate epimerase